MEAAAVGVPDKRLGELVAAVVSLKPEYREKITEESLIALARTRFVHDLWLLRPRHSYPHQPA